jgi:cell wall-associated NlpC family hydrolase
MVTKDPNNMSGSSVSQNILNSTAYMEKFNATLEKTLKLSNEIAKSLNIGGAGGGTAGGGNATANGGGGNLTTKGSFSGFVQGVKTVASFALGAAGAAAQAMPGLKETLNTQLLTSQAKFSGFQGNVTSTVRSAMMGGTTDSPYDAIEAVAQGTQAGLLPGMPGYNKVLGGVAQVSNLTGSMSSAMQATSALNSGASVNKLRMFGINVRNAQGTMRSPSEIFKDIFNFAQQQSGKKLTKQDIAIGMQSGNGLSNFLDSVSGGDANLRGALQSAALQFSSGGDLSKESLTKTGQLTAASNAQSNLNAAKFGLTSAAAPAMSEGFVEGADLLSKYNDKLANLISTSDKAAYALKQLAKAETLAADNLGKAGLGMAAVIAGAVAQLAGFLAGKGLSGLGGGGTTVAGGKAPGARPGMGTGAKLGLGSIAALLATMGLDKLFGDKVDDSTRVRGNAAAGIGGYALTGAALGSFIPFLGTGIGAVLGTGYGLFKNGADLVSGGGDAYGTQGSETSSPAAATSTGRASGSILATAESQLGVPYSWGGGSNQGPTSGTGRGAKTVGFDCSSFVRYVMSKSGVVLPRTANQQQRCGIKINPKDAQPGDLLFWGDPAHHVAIYAGNGIMIHAPRTGGNVERVGVNLESVTSCSRVINGNTGTSSLPNLNDPQSSENNTGGVDGKGVSANTLGTGNNLFAAGDLVGYSPEAAMSGNAVSGSGLGQGASTGSAYGSNTNSSAQQYLFINQKTGQLETHSSSANPNVINYGGVTITVDTKGAQVSAKEIGKAVKEELNKIGISSKVVSK